MSALNLTGSVAWMKVTASGGVYFRTPQTMADTPEEWDGLTRYGWEPLTRAALSVAPIEQDREDAQQTITLTERTPLEKAMYIADRYAGGKHDDALRAMLEQAIVDYGSSVSVAPSQDREDVVLMALERVTHSYRMLLSGKPVRDVSETLAEADAALSVAPSQDREDALIAAVSHMREWQKQCPSAPWAIEKLEASEAFVDAALAARQAKEPTT